MAAVLKGSGSADFSVHCAFPEELQRAQNKHGQLLPEDQSVDSSATQCTFLKERYKSAKTNMGSCAKGIRVDSSATQCTAEGV
jgi:hypothetical protein